MWLVFRVTNLLSVTVVDFDIRTFERHFHETLPKTYRRLQGLLWTTGSDGVLFSDVSSASLQSCRSVPQWAPTVAASF